MHGGQCRVRREDCGRRFEQGRAHRLCGTEPRDALRSHWQGSDHLQRGGTSRVDGCGWHDDTEWFNVAAWGELAETCKSQLSEGMLVYVAGRLQTRTWQDSEGIQCFCTEIVADEMIVLQETTEE
jgi:hypothetical protein